MTKQKLGILLALLFCIGCALAQERQRHFELKANSKQFWKLVPKGARLEKIAGGMGFTEGPVWDPSGFVYVSDADRTLPQAEINAAQHSQSIGR